MSDFNPREAIRLSEIDNILEDSIFKSSNGAKLADYIRKKRGGGGRVRLHNIFEQVAANMPKPNFNFDMDSSDPNPLPDSPDPLASAVPGLRATSSVATLQNRNVVVQMVASTPPTETPSSSTVNHVRQASPNNRGKSPAPVVNLGKQALLNQYHRTNTAKCELLKQITSSTPKPDTNTTMSRISAFTTSISPIIESSASPPRETPHPVAVNRQSSGKTNPFPNHSIDQVPPTQVLAPCSQIPMLSTPKKVIVVAEPAEPIPEEPDMIIPETPSPVKVPLESPKVSHLHQPRKLTDTFNNIQNGRVRSPNQSITSDESESIETEQPSMPNVSQHNGDNSIMVKSILKEKDASPFKKRVSNRVSFSQQLVQEREISPAPSIPEARYSSSSDDDDDSSDNESEEYALIDEVYSEEEAECDHDNIQENEDDENSMERHMENIHGRSPSPLINVVDDAPVRWYETRTPRGQENPGLAPLVTCTKENKTNLQLLDIITDWDEEDDDDEDEQQEKEQPNQDQIQEKEPEQPSIVVTETQQLTHHTNQTNCQTIDITNVEDLGDRLVELPPLPEECNTSKNYAEPVSPTNIISPPSQFTDSAKRRFLMDNENALISRLQNELPDSQHLPTHNENDKVSETLAEVIQSFREQHPKPVTSESSRPLVPISKKNRRVLVDPATTSYFETVEKTFVKPKIPAHKPPTTAQKRKLYATSEHLASPEKSQTDTDILCRKLNIVVSRIQLGEFLQQLTDGDRKILNTMVRKKPLPDLAKGKSRKLHQENRIDTQPGDRQAQTNSSEFAGFNKNSQQGRELLTKKLADAVSNAPTIERSKASLSTDVEREKGNPADASSEKRLTSSIEDIQQPEALEMLNRQSEFDRQDEEQAVFRQPIISDNTKTNSQKNPTENKKRGRQRKDLNANTEDTVLTRIPNGAINERVPSVASGEEPETRNLIVSERLESVSSTSLNSQVKSHSSIESSTPASSGSKASPKSKKKPITDNAQNNLQKKKRGRPRKDLNANKEDTALTRLPNGATNWRVPSVSSGEESDIQNVLVSERLDSNSSTEPSKLAFNGSEEPLKSKKSSRTKVTSTSSEAGAPGSSEDLTKDTCDSSPSEDLPLERRSVQTASEDEPPALEPFGADNAIETSDIEPPLLLSQDPVTNVRRQKNKNKTNKHYEKHTTETSEKLRIPKKGRYYHDQTEECDETWMPSKKAQKDHYNKQLRKAKGANRANANSVEDSDSEPIRRSKRKCRLAKATLMLNPFKSVYDKPDYKLATDEELIALQKKLEEENRKKKKAKVNATEESTAIPRPVNRKRVQGAPEEAVISKRNKPDNSRTQVTQQEQTAVVTDTGTVSTDRLMQEKMDTYDWIHKLMHGNPEENERIPVVGDLVRYSLQHLTFKEHKGIQYSFYLRSDNENFGFLKFSPLAVKKLTKTSNFQLKFLVISGSLTFNLNGNTCPIKSGDFLMLPENSRYGIENGEEVSLIFMAKICSQEL